MDVLPIRQPRRAPQAPVDATYDDLLLEESDSEVEEIQRGNERQQRRKPQRVQFQDHRYIQDLEFSDDESVEELQITGKSTSARRGNTPTPGLPYPECILQRLKGEPPPEYREFDDGAADIRRAVAAQEAILSAYALSKLYHDHDTAFAQGGQEQLWEPDLAVPIANTKEGKSPSTQQDVDGSEGKDRVKKRSPDLFMNEKHGDCLPHTALDNQAMREAQQLDTQWIRETPPQVPNQILVPGSTVSIEPRFKNGRIYIYPCLPQLADLLAELKCDEVPVKPAVNVSDTESPLNGKFGRGGYLDIDHPHSDQDFASEHAATDSRHDDKIDTSESHNSLDVAHSGTQNEKAPAFRKRRIRDRISKFMHPMLNRRSARREVKVVFEEWANEKSQQLSNLDLEASEKIALSDPVIHRKGVNPVDGQIANDSSSRTIDSSTDYSEEDEKEFMKLLSNVPVAIQDFKGVPHAVHAVIDTGAGSSFISKRVVEQYYLKERALHPHDVKSFAAVDDVGYTPTTFVDLQVKSLHLGLNDFVRTHVRVLDVNNFEIIFGRPFIQKHGILNKLATRPQSIHSGNTLLFIRERYSWADNAVVNSQDVQTDLVHVTEHDPPTDNSVPSPDDEIVPADASLSNHYSEVFDLDSRSETDSDEESIDENDENDRIGVVPSGIMSLTEEGGDLVGLLEPLRQEMVDKLMADFFNIFDQDQVENTRRCANSSDTPLTPGDLPADKSKAQPLTNGKDKKRSRGNEDDGNSEDNNGGPHKRKKPGLAEPTDSSHKFACPYRKYDPHMYCAVSRKLFITLQLAIPPLTPFRSHLYRHHKIDQCTRCGKAFDDEKALKEHEDAATECERRKSDEAEGIRGVNAKLERRLRSRKKTDSTQSQEDRWMKIFMMLFGEDNLPTPYFEPVVEELAHHATVSSPDSQQLAHFEEYLREELPRIIQTNLERTALNEIRTIEERLRRSLNNVIRDSQDQAFSNYRLRFTPSEDSFSSSPDQGVFKRSLLTPGYSMGPPGIGPDTLSQDSLERLGSFYNQPPQEKVPGGQANLLITNVSPYLRAEHAFSDSGFQTFSEADASDTATTTVVSCSKSAYQNSGSQALDSSTCPSTECSPLLHRNIQGNEDLLASKHADFGVSQLPTEGSMVIGDINETADPETMDLWDVLFAG
ncbi:hypothetical protein G7Y89_g4121 [Cudoniella acicularis]|uniref:C2H2-type domain-containing protein n=1 Tax=Cudoniella acicularis TaxID=354080 RepID=A0A8H4W4Z8_9HELO|nr:hypothetical protein G7Y89_g4121 [Cudoniella acicularis]